MSSLLTYRTLAIAVVAALFTTTLSGQEFRYQKTLFQWSGSEGEEEEEPEVDRIVTDRPHFSEASSLVGLGTVQLETGYTIFRNDDGGVNWYCNPYCKVVFNYIHSFVTDRNGSPSEANAWGLRTQLDF